MKKVLIIFYMGLFAAVNTYGVNDKIFSQGNLTAKTLANFLLLGNSELGDELVNEFAKIYIEEAAFEGINWDVAFVQMCLETGYLKFGGLVTINQNNFCGLGSFDNEKGAEFPTVREGVRAHIQHLKAYSTTEGLKGTLLDPRFHYVERGSAITVKELAGKWATDPDYGIKLLSLLERVHVLDSPTSSDIAIGAEIISEPIITEVNDTVTRLQEIVNDKTKSDKNVLESSANKKDVYKVVIGGGWVR